MQLLLMNSFNAMMHPIMDLAKMLNRIVMVDFSRIIRGIRTLLNAGMINNLFKLRHQNRFAFLPTKCPWEITNNKIIWLILIKLDWHNYYYEWIVVIVVGFIRKGEESNVRQCHWLFAHCDYNYYYYFEMWF